VNTHLDISFAGETLRLLADRAIYWKNESTLFIADPHFGKDASLRAQSVPLPDLLGGDLERLANLFTLTGAERLVILGDFYHDRDSINKTQNETLAAFKKEHAGIEFILIRGNHDLKSGDPDETLGIRVVDPPFVLKPFICLHDPEECTDDGAYHLAGHLHPGVSFRVNRKEGASMPAFSISKNLLVLPAFGRLTGKGGSRLNGKEGLVAIADNELIDLRHLKA